MIEEFALWLGCNPMMQDPALCVVNTLLIAPGVIGMMAIMTLYILGVFILVYIALTRFFRVLRLIK